MVQSNQQTKTSTAKIINKPEAIKLMADNFSIFVTGSFDVMHLGHLNFLKQAKNLAKQNNGILVVAVINDDDIKERKGIARPVNNLAERTKFLSHIDTVDYVMPWNEPWQNLRQFVQDAKPKILAITKGDPAEENKREQIEMAGGKLAILPKLGNYSTTNLIDKIKTT
jgi:D-beta-D-heptose 7-phosphate kinase/D-beta-D-heptose 1-phosphate adenosyltransferase